MSREGQAINQMARIGTLSEHVVCPAEHLAPIREEMPWPQAALLGCCVPTVVGAVTRWPTPLATDEVIDECARHRQRAEPPAVLAVP